MPPKVKAKAPAKKGAPAQSLARRAGAQPLTPREPEPEPQPRRAPPTPPPPAPPLPQPGRKGQTTPVIRRSDSQSASLAAVGGAVAAAARRKSSGLPPAGAVWPDGGDDAENGIGGKKARPKGGGSRKARVAKAKGDADADGVSVSDMHRIEDELAWRQLSSISSLHRARSVERLA